MKEKTIHRTCEDCGENKRTTVHEDEEEVYYCEDCLKKTARTAYEKSSSTKGFVIMIVIAIIAFLIGKLL